MSKHPLRNKMAKARLDSFMKDPRYFDGNHPEHASCCRSPPKRRQSPAKACLDRGPSAKPNPWPLAKTHGVR